MIDDDYGTTILSNSFSYSPLAFELYGFTVDDNGILTVGYDWNCWKTKLLLQRRH